MRIRDILLYVLVLPIFCSCGLNDPKYVNYVEEVAADNPTEPADPCATESLALFAANINGPLVETCGTSGCHGATPIAGSTVSATSGAENLATIKAFTGTDPNTLYDKISASNGQTHGGGDQSAVLSLDAITTWTTKEAECDAG